MSRSKSGLLLALMAAMGALNPSKPRPPKVKKTPLSYSGEDQDQLDKLFQDRTSPGRKAYKLFQKELKLKYNTITSED